MMEALTPSGMCHAGRGHSQPHFGAALVILGVILVSPCAFFPSGFNRFLALSSVELDSTRIPISFFLRGLPPLRGCLLTSDLARKWGDSSGTSICFFGKLLFFAGFPVEI